MWKPSTLFVCGILDGCIFLNNMSFLGLEERDSEKDRKERGDCSNKMDFLRCDFGRGF